MPVSIQISDAIAETLRQVSLKELADKQGRIKALEAECKDLETLLGQLNPYQTVLPLNKDSPFPVTSVAIQAGYKEKWTWEDKIKFIIGYKNKMGITTADIVETLIEFEPRYLVERSKAVGSISAVLSTKSKPGGIFGKEFNERKEYVYYVNEDIAMDDIVDPEL